MGATPSASKISSKKEKKSFLPECVSCSLTTSKVDPENDGVHVSGKADRAEGFLRLRDSDTSLITFREKQLSPAQTILLPTNESGYSKQEEKKRSFTTRRRCV
jgi:hypothetical protein